MTAEKVQIEYGSYMLDGYATMTIAAGNRGTERIVPPAGEEHAYDHQRWARSVQVTVSPTGRSVRVFVDGVEVKP